VPLFVNAYPGYLSRDCVGVTPSLYEYPAEEQKRLGYTPIEHDLFIEREMTIKANLFSNGDAQQSANFTLSELPTDLKSSYIGYVMEDAEPNNYSDFKSNAIRRVFEQDGIVISLEESSAKNGTSHFIKEFVNYKIGDYPALFSTLKKGSKQFEQLIWDTDTHRYAMYGLSNKPPAEVRKQLLEIAERLTELNKVK
jgi:hypothetical protein